MPSFSRLFATIFLTFVVSCAGVGGRGGLPPWWILNGVTPDGSKDNGSFQSVAFSAEQQARFGVDEQGAVVDKVTFDTALQSL
eukprot:CAMPEP_0194492504 /NCGR_PEP_ID=MMETSP0253-20130528/11035_1 /TAXON_ID=2966 /ORGANISM="Noctiluca scintillans" /LENGTH=82 /DNA_ID=CAMNT_0039333375 /DNA_START=24 /DNA_END=268 /DNA_ORIENTATION=-